MKPWSNEAIPTARIRPVYGKFLCIPAHRSQGSVSLGLEFWIRCALTIRSGWIAVDVGQLYLSRLCLSWSLSLISQLRTSLEELLSQRTAIMATADVATVAVAGDGVPLLYAAIVLLVLSWTVYGMRVGVRVWRKAFGLDDIMMLIGIVSSSTMAVRRSILTDEIASLLGHCCVVHCLLLLWFWPVCSGLASPDNVEGHQGQ
jgi:hypothetical protein